MKQKLGTLQWHPAMATASTPPKLVVTLPPNHSTLQWHLQWHHPQSWPSPSPPLAHYNGTLQWHPAMAPPAMATRPPQPSKAHSVHSLKVGRHPSSTLQWHPAMATTPSPHHQHTTMAPCNGTQQMAPRPLPHKVALPSPHHSTLQWHPGGGTQQWHHVRSCKVGRHPAPQP